MSNGRCGKRRHLRVAVTRFLFEVPDIPEGSYDWLRTYLCVVQAGTVVQASNRKSMGKNNPSFRTLVVSPPRPETWDALLREDEITYRMLQQVRAALGHLS